MIETMGGYCGYLATVAGKVDKSPDCFNMVDIISCKGVECCPIVCRIEEIAGIGIQRPPSHTVFMELL